MLIGNFKIEKIFNENGKVIYVSYKDLEDPGYEYKEYTLGIKKWYRNGELHREEGPAVIYDNGKKEWWIHGKRHREDGPAIIFHDGVKFWYKNGRLVRTTKA